MYVPLYGHQAYISKHESLTERWVAKSQRFTTLYNTVQFLSQQFLKCDKGFQHIATACYMFNKARRPPS